MLGFEQVLMQVVLNSTGPAAEVAGDAFMNSLTSIMGSFTALVIAVAAIIPALIAIRSAGRNKTKQEEQVVGAAEAIQLIMQKLREQQGQIGAVGKGLLNVTTTDEQRKQLDKDVAPVVNMTKERMDVILAQIPALKEILGVKTGDVNANKTVPRESDATLAQLNKTVSDAQTGV